MSKIKNISLEAIATLGKSITFSTWKGIPYLKKRNRKLGPNRAPLVVRGNERFRIAARALKALDKSMIVHYKGWALGSTYTWKDQFMAMYLRYWAKFNQAPIVVTKTEYAWVENEIVCCVWMGNYFARPGEGYGTLAYGSSPYGHRDKFYAEDGWPLNREMIVRKGSVPSPRWAPGRH